MNPTNTVKAQASRRALRLMLQGSVDKYIAFLTRQVARIPQARA